MSLSFSLRLVAVPRVVCALREHVAVFSGNQLASLPDSFANLTQLTTLKLQCVSPSSSPPRRRATRCVRCVRVVVEFSKNKLTSLPDSFGNLPQLAWLDLGCVHRPV